MSKFGVVVLSFLLIIAIAGCDQLDSLKSLKGLSKTKVASVGPTGPILGKVNNWILTVEEFEDQIDEIIQANDGKSEIIIERLGLLARTFMPSSVDKIDLGSVEGKRAYLIFLVNLELLAQEAESRELDKDPEIARNLRRATVEILDFSLLNNELKDIAVTPLEVEDFYNSDYKATLENIEQRKVREIIVTSEAKAKEIVVALLRGSDFSSLASSESIAESASEGGDLGYLIYQPNIKFTKFWEIVLTSEKGQVSSIFKNPDKLEYYVIMVEDIKKGEPESLSKVYDQLEFLIKQRKSFEAIDSLINSIKAKSDVFSKSEMLN